MCHETIDSQLLYFSVAVCEKLRRKRSGVCVCACMCVYMYMYMYNVCVCVCYFHIKVVHVILPIEGFRIFKL